DALFVGVESGSDAQLRRYGKPATTKSLAEGIRRAKRAHMLVVGFFVYGGPGETDQDFEATQKFIQEVRPHICGGSALSIQPQAILWDKLIGDAEPLSLADSHPRQMYTIPGQLDNEVIRRRRRGLRQAFLKSWRHWRRIIDVLDLLKYNLSARRAARPTLKDIKLLLGKGGSKPSG
ncbi:MAG: radical SAM protein, partial [Proteobacteria bacterium]|nr:radical SAM protein [Pseudomonadota bacterium]